MKYIELKAGMPAITKLYEEARGALALKVRGVVKPLFESYKEYSEETRKLFESAGAEKDGDNLMVPKPDPEDKKAVEAYNGFIQDWSEMQQAEVSYEIPSRIPLSSLGKVPLNCPEIDVLVSLGIVEDDL